MTEPKWLMLTAAREDPHDGVRRVAGPQQRVAVRYILRFYQDPHPRGSTIVVFAIAGKDGNDCRFHCLESVETIEAWLAGKPAPAPAPAPPPKRVKTIYPIEALYGRPMTVVVQAILRFDPTSTVAQVPGAELESLAVECEERHRAVIDELFKPPPSRETAFADTDRPVDPPKPLDGEKQGS